MDNTVFTITFEDIEAILGRELLSEEKIIVSDKFEIPDWSDYVKDFLELRGIE
jgi:hypothetical protein